MATSAGGKTQEIVVARGKTLDLIRPDDAGKIQTLHPSTSSVPFAPSPSSASQAPQKDYVVVGSDSGPHLHQETFGKSGCRRIVPGQYLAVDPKGRAVMIAACEKQKLVYVLNRDTVARLTISSPLEAHKSHTITYSITGVDCGFDNPYL
ncbi:hypothetical protein J5N97_013635 [Dioscorea zingiberensis]|uniref:RSE1/DDB1/CPSF1 first beta-propeller domain-containing protein n=1 Tax=Dioscorea zingiberensis TaxID=325984 RepID=A0A9D5CR61_9LILI|nr:hypothetical protein J5N97_013635 [Dioscorea zingiberensis]